VTPREVLGHAKGLGFRLSLRPGGLRLTGAEEPPPELVALIREHRDALLALLEWEAQAWPKEVSEGITARVSPAAFLPSFYRDTQGPGEGAG
jgi:hypothetical protein